ncbi:hypothetical protein CYMTET_28822 [Cymbomonas tetramitiformis]|uniref:Uncharacterized protein n=1 Tax=Cymbomonas tetramitiformis TaxID=36881 RepID=A0AAE0FMC5_9CHLO|nr:hypothetical protein CYMTET_28822 [Cymbomonas tetramitiformis]
MATIQAELAVQEQNIETQRTWLPAAHDELAHQQEALDREKISKRTLTEALKVERAHREKVLENVSLQLTASAQGSAPGTPRKGEEHPGLAELHAKNEHLTWFANHCCGTLEHRDAELQKLRRSTKLLEDQVHTLAHQLKDVGEECNRWRREVDMQKRRESVSQGFHSEGDVCSAVLRCVEDEMRGVKRAVAPGTERDRLIKSVNMSCHPDRLALLPPFCQKLLTQVVTGTHAILKS